MLDGKIVAVSTKTARKNKEFINFVSKDAQQLVFDTVMEYIDWGDYDYLDHDDISDEWFNLDNSRDRSLITEMRI